MTNTCPTGDVGAGAVVVVEVPDGDDELDEALPPFALDEQAATAIRRATAATRRRRIGGPYISAHAHATDGPARDRTPGDAGGDGWRVLSPAGLRGVRRRRVRLPRRVGHGPRADGRGDPRRAGR